MYGIILDTSFKLGYLILIDIVNEIIIYEKKFPLDAAINEFEVLYKKFSIKENLKFISVGIGPGSFTGIRSSLCIAYSLCFVLKIPLISFCSLKAYLPVNIPNKTFFSAYSINTNTIALLKCFIKKNNILEFEKTPIFLKNNFNLIKENVFSPEDNLLKIKGLKNVFNCSLNLKYLSNLIIDKYIKKDFISIKNLIPFYY